MKPEEFDEAFEKWLKERFKPFRDKQRPERLRQATSPRTPRRRASPRSSPSPRAPRARWSPPSPPTAPRARPTSCCSRPRTAACIKNLTERLHGRLREHLASTTSSWPAARIAFDPEGDTVAFFARNGQGPQPVPGLRARRATSCKQIPVDARPGAGPLPAPRRQARALRGPQGGRLATSGSLDLETRRSQEPDPGRLLRRRPRRSRPTASSSSTRGASAATTRSTSSRSTDPGEEDAAHLRPLRRRRRRIFSSDGNKLYYSSNEDDDIYNLRSLDLRTGAVAAVHGRPRAATWRPRPSRRRAASGSAFISYFKGEYNLHVEGHRGADEGGRPGRAGSPAEDLVDFQPDVAHQVVPENKREQAPVRGPVPRGPAAPQRRRDLRRRLLRRHPGRARPTCWGTRTSPLTVLSVREFRSYDGHAT